MTKSDSEPEISLDTTLNSTDEDRTHIHTIHIHTNTHPRTHRYTCTYTHMNPYTHTSTLMYILAKEGLTLVDFTTFSVNWDKFNKLFN